MIEKLALEGLGRIVTHLTTIRCVRSISLVSAVEELEVNWLVEPSSTGTSTDLLAARARACAFEALFQTGGPVPIEDLAARMCQKTANVRGAILRLEKQGLIRRNDSGDVVASYGLSVVPSRDEIHVDGRRFWSWCAKTSLGVLGALAKGGEVLSRSPASGEVLRVVFTGSRPSPSALAVFWPAPDYSERCTSVVDEVCVNINFFEHAAGAVAWAADQNIRGEVLSLEEATDRAAEHWAPLLSTR